mgnify:CR=1 FL=1
MESGAIKIVRARQHNLKEVSLELPLNRLIAVTGVSGSGKSSLAFDTLYAEGQRRYIETFSPYARQFLERMDRPDAEAIESVPPAIAFDQSQPVKTSRSTVGTMTELCDHVKLLFAKAATLHCRGCGRPARPHTARSVRAELTATLGPGSRLAVTFPYTVPEGGLAPLAARGFTRLLAGGRPVELAEAKTGPGSEVEVLVDRLPLAPKYSQRLLDSLEQALKGGHGEARVQVDGESLRFSAGLSCPYCRLTYRPAPANLFSFNSPLGACETCRGFGRTMDIDLAQVVPEPKLTLAMGAIRMWSPETNEFAELMDFCRRAGIPTNLPWRKLSEEQRRRIVEGEGSWYGVRGWFRWLETKRYKMHVRVYLSRYRAYTQCPACRGTRFKPDTLLYRLGGLNIAQVYALSVDEASRYFRGLKPHGKAQRELLREIRGRLGYLSDVGLGYLTLERQSRTLSGGEVERVHLTRALGSSLVNTLYVLDEPSIGLHPRDSRRLMDILRRLRDAGNTVVVVEHDPEVIRRADLILDMGPGPGEHGGQVVYFGPAEGVLSEPASLTGRYLSGEKSIPVPQERRKPKGWLKVFGAAANNLKDIDVRIPLGVVCALTGVSGSGKSSLVEEVLLPGLTWAAGSGWRPRALRRLEGADKLRGVTLIDQQPIGRTPRSNPLTYLKAFDAVRQLFARSEEAGQFGLAAGDFSFNAGTGRCQACRGEGFERVEMQFLSDVFLRCEVCGGRRYGPEVLSVRYQGKAIDEVLEMTVAEALEFFGGDDRWSERVRAPLRALSEVGLGYLRLGQPANTLSGGEAQRLKLARYLQIRGTGRLFILDEPTTGLHFEDIARLLAALSRLVAEGNSVLVVEHNLEVIKAADWVIDLGPEGGEAGGRLVAAGTPEEVARAKGSHTGRFLAPLLRPAARPRMAASPVPPRPKGAAIAIRGAAEHNLKELDLDIPRGQLVVFSGLSGSGKSSLAFDIVFAEGQRRYIESLPAYARQYLKVMDRPEVRAVLGLPPTVAVEQRLARAGTRSTVATVTEAYHYLRLLYSKLGEQRCPRCGGPVGELSAPRIASEIIRRFGPGEVELLAPKVAGRKGFHKPVLERARKRGFLRLRVDGRFVGVLGVEELSRHREHSIDYSVAITQAAERNRARLEEKVALALSEGRGTVFVLANGEQHTFSQTRTCPNCQIGFAPLDPRLFSFNSRVGWCPECEGMGWTSDFDERLLVPDEALPVEQAVKVLSGLEKPARQKLLRDVRRLGIDVGQPYASLSEETKRALLHGGRGQRGLIPTLREALEWAEEGSARAQYLSQFLAERPCPACSGHRLNEQARNVLVNGRAIHEVCALPVEEAAAYFAAFKPLGEREEKIAAPILAEIGARLHFMQQVGLGYLGLDRRAETLSGGEAERIRLAAQLGSNLTGALYVLDEPTVGLHPRDGARLLETLRLLRARGNSVLVVEHDEETILAADHVVDLGPGAGAAGGRLVAQGSPAQIVAAKGSLTGQALRDSGRRRIMSLGRRAANGNWLKITGARGHNLKGIEAAIPLGTLTVVTGVSGSGKSTLVKDTLEAALKARLGLIGPAAAPHDALSGAEHLERVLDVDHSPIGRTPRSTPASYVGLWDHIRRLFALTPEARARGYGPGRFSFNVRGGRCEVCAGQGRIREEMAFLPDVYVLCEACGGQRFGAETLEVRWRGKSIADVLAMTVEEAAALFATRREIARPLEVLRDLGLGYLELGQPSPTLSGGEAERIKLAHELGKGSSGRGRTLYILDEPTTGLHIVDAARLVDVLQRLVERGNTAVVIEHNPEIIKWADWVIDLGPEGGEAGGELVFAGSPQELLAHPTSHTAAAMRRYLAGQGHTVASLLSHGNYIK